jgi:anti-sigma factor RsiW
MDYLEGVLPPAVRAQLDEHVGGCPRCQAFLASYRETPRVLRDATSVVAPADLARAVLDFVRRRN